LNKPGETLSEFEVQRNNGNAIRLTKSVCRQRTRKVVHKPDTSYQHGFVEGELRVNPNLSKAFIANRVNEFVEKILE